MALSDSYRCWFCNRTWTRKGTTPKRDEEGTCSMFGAPCSAETEFFREKARKTIT